MKKSLRLMATMLLLAVFGMVSAQNVVFKETFDQTTGTGGNDNKWSGTIANSGIKTDVEGWNFTTAGGAYKCVKITSTKKSGKAVTPEITLTGDATLTFRAGAWGSDNTILNLSITNASLNTSAIKLETLVST
jgi:hypothetical protein